ncbi:type II toxin-antitoxin system prevent-host-death family antitoxin [Pontimonas sp.]|uniref:type II toxin-antitoxin system Phd/YefM family antitoxin n=1 Tax=Pontimonas sp. TaxID=2304492 RepID=UPI00286FC632|nr:type II toxin-antitoxin system prevent-host-death family antitoxin [Pontimonas sp.]MDR9396595.1 type II toxin-antitoxin system prevent-host-death family antitoxin [Pontimonas sp.]
MGNNHVGLRQLGQNVSRVLERVKRGEVLVVTEFGKPIAKISPVGEPRTLEEAVEMGQVTPPTADLRDFLARGPLPSADGEPLSDILERMRRDER